MKITIWNEYKHEKENEQVGALYPEGIHGALAHHLSGIDGFEVTTAWLDQPDHGLPQSLIDQTDVMLWWGHRAHNELSDEAAQRVQAAVQRGMGFIALHSAHYSKPFRLLMGTSCALSWRVGNDHERLWLVDPTHPIADGVNRYIDLPEVEMYGEFFDVPTPEELVFVSWFSGGEVFRSGMVWKRGYGKIFYFRPGHETIPIYKNKDVLRVIENACSYVCRTSSATVTGIGDALHAKVGPEEELKS